VRRAVRRNLYYDAGVIKLIAEANRYHYSAEEIRAAVDEAHRAGVPVPAQAYGGGGAQAAIDGGVDSIEHGFELTDMQLGQMKAKGIFLVGTDFPRAIRRTSRQFRELRGQGGFSAIRVAGYLKFPHLALRDCE
jgi:imidazolonepropionase-like amidohydrolase